MGTPEGEMVIKLSSTAYEEAGAKGADTISTGDMKIDNVAKMMKEAAANDPANHLRKALAVRVAEHCRKTVSDVAAQVVDIGCGVGADIGMMLAEMPECKGMKGVDIMDTVLDVARKDYPEPTKFFKGDVHDMSFLDDNSQDVVRCSKLLIHAQDVKKALNEIIRIMKPGGLATLVEGEMAKAEINSDDETVKKVFSIQNAATIAHIKNPRVATDMHEYLQTVPLVENLVMDVDTHTMPDGPFLQMMLNMQMQVLAKRVEQGELTQPEVDLYQSALSSGSATVPCSLSIVSFNKK